MTDRLRIAQIAPIAGPVLRDSGGAIEQIVWLLTEDLVRRGHEVTLFATGESRTSAALHATYPRDYEHEDLSDWRFHETLHVAAAFERAVDFDLIHSHDYHYALPFTRLTQTPVVHTYHVLPNEDHARCFARYREAHVVALSRYQRRSFRRSESVAVVPHGIDTAAFPFKRRGGDYLLFLGRMTGRKGPVHAIRLARSAGMRLVLAGELEDEEFFEKSVSPLVDGRQVEYAGAVHGARRNALLAGAAALLYPIREPEPFGLVVVEALACGTPVLALKRGAVPELIEPGVTGFYANDLGSLAGHLPAALALDRSRIRREAVARFDYHRMTDDYLRLYRRVILPAELRRLAG